MSNLPGVSYEQAGSVQVDDVWRYTNHSGSVIEKRIYRSWWCFAKWIFPSRVIVRRIDISMDRWVRIMAGMGDIRGVSTLDREDAIFRTFDARLIERNGKPINSVEDLSNDK